MARMHVYTVHILPTLPHPYEAAQFVEEGFSWKAFFFTVLWALYHRLWWIAAGIMVINAVLMGCFETGIIGNTGTHIVVLGVNLLIGFHANDWRRKALTKRGYLMADIVTGNSLLLAEQRFFEQYFSSHPMAA